LLKSQKKNPQGRKRIADDSPTVIIGFRDSEFFKEKLVAASKKLGLNASDVLRSLTKDFIKKVDGISTNL